MLRRWLDSASAVRSPIPLRNEKSADLLLSSDGHLGAADIDFGLR